MLGNCLPMRVMVGAHVAGDCGIEYLLRYALRAYDRRRLPRASGWAEVHAIHSSSGDVHLRHAATLRILISRMLLWLLGRHGSIELNLAIK